MELPRTRPSGRNPTSRTSRNSLTDRSEVKIDPGRPGCSSARRRMASCGTPAASSSVAMFCWSVIVSPALYSALSACALSCVSNPDPGRLAALRVERHDGQRGTAVELLGIREPGDRGPDVGGLDDV